MPSAQLTVSRQSIPQLVQVLKNEIAAGRKKIQEAQGETLWSVGRHISIHLLQNKDRAGYGARLFARLVKSLGIDKTTLYQSVQFYEQYPNFRPGGKLGWGHYRRLLTLPDNSVRRKLFKKAVDKNLTTRELQQEIKTLEARKPFKIDPDAPIPQLKAQRGTLYTYTAFEDEDGAKFIDCGFDTWHFIPSVRADSGAVVESVKTPEGNYQVKTSSRTAKDLYTFKARVQRVIDGDTLWVRVDLGFNNFSRQKLRLRGIDCPELEPSANIPKKALEKDQLVLRAEGEARTTALQYPGQAAKKFVQSLVKPKDTVVIRTHKDDKYGRYLVDLWYTPAGKGQVTGGEPQATVFLNQELLNNRLAVAVKS